MKLRFAQGVALVALSACGGRHGAASSGDDVDDAGRTEDAGGSNASGDAASPPAYKCSSVTSFGDRGVRPLSGHLDLTSFWAGFLFLPILAAGPDGDLWFISDREGTPTSWSLDRITPTGNVTEIRRAGSPFGDSLSTWRFRAVVAGPDGNVWANEVDDTSRTAFVTRTTPAGEVAAFSVEGATQLGGIAVGADGNLWFTEFAAEQRIGLVTLEGEEVHQTTWNTAWEPTADPIGAIAAGPDGNLWFAEAPGRIGRVNVGGMVSEFGLPSPTNRVESIAAAPDGNVWFRGVSQEADGTAVNLLGRVTPTACITEFRFNLDNRKLGTGLVAAANGALWFAADDELVQFIPPATLLEYALPLERPLSAGDSTGEPCLDGELDCVPPHADAIALGPDGHIWFTDDSTPSHVVRISAVR
jgi:virginiamycin B lyase